MGEKLTTLREPVANQRRPTAASAVRRRSAVASPPASQVLHRRLGNQGTRALIHRSVESRDREPAAIQQRDAPTLTAFRSASPPPAIRSQPAPVLTRTVQRVPQPAAAPAVMPMRAPSSPQLSISSPGDAHEREADTVADLVMRMAEPRAPETPRASIAPAGSLVQRKCTSCEEEHADKLKVQRKETTAATPEATAEVAANITSLKGGGTPLPPATRAFFEPRFGADFSGVRVHTGGKADSTAKAIQAKAFTVGSDIVFAGGHYAPESNEGKQLLAHELTHVVQQGGASTQVNRWTDSAKLGTVTPANSATVQRAWYNFNIPFTDYQFDPSIEGIKTAAGVVRDTAVEAVEWIVDEIRGLVNSGIDWLTRQWEGLKEFASSAFNAARDSFTNIISFIKDPLGFLADAFMSLDAQAIARAWASFSKLVSTVANGFRAATNNLLGGVNRIWGGINGFATSLLNRLAGLTNNFVFKKLPNALQQLAIGLVNRLRSFWKRISDSWNALFGQIKTWTEGALNNVFTFVKRVLSFAINVVIAGIVRVGRVVLFLRDFFRDPKKYLTILAQRSVRAFDGIENRFAGIVSEYFGSQKTTTTAAPVVSTASMVVQRQPAAKPASTEAKRSASWAEIGTGVWRIMKDKWAEFKANPLQLVLTLLLDLYLPIVGNIQDVIHLFKEVKKVVTGPLGAGSLEEFWTSLLLILDIPIMIYHTVVGILMRTLMLPLIVASFIPEPIVQTVATAVGYSLLAAFLQAEGMNLGHKLLLLKTGATTSSQREDAYNRIADSLIALIMAAAMVIIVLLLKFIASVARGIINFIKGKIFTPEVKPAEVKGPTSGEGKPAEGKGKGGPEEAKGAEAKTGKEVPTEDGKRKLKINKEGKCEVCFSPCDDVRKKYPGLVTPEIEAKLKAIEGDPTLTEAQQLERLKPIEQKLAELAKERFDRLGRDPQTGKQDPKSVGERDAILQAEKEGLVQQPERPDLAKGDPNLDFKVKGPKPYEFADTKTPVNRGDLVAQAEGIGKKIFLQKAGSSNVLHIVDLKNIPPAEKPAFKVNVIKGAGSPTGIGFIND